MVPQPRSANRFDPVTEFYLIALIAPGFAWDECKMRNQTGTEYLVIIDFLRAVLQEIDGQGSFSPPSWKFAYQIWPLTACSSCKKSYEASGDNSFLDALIRVFKSQPNEPTDKSIYT